MELRALLLIPVLCLAVSAAAAAPVKRFPLDDRAVYAIRISTEAPTTVTFPDKIAGLEGMNLSQKGDDTPPVLLSHQAEANYFSVRALRPDASAAVNVIIGGKVIALTFTTDADPDRTITFTEGTVAPATNPDRSPARLLSLLDQAEHYDQLTTQYPALAQQIEHQPQAHETSSATAPSGITEVFRFERQGALVLRAYIANRAATTLHLDPSRLGVAVGTRTFPVTLTDAGSDLPANTRMELWLVLTGEAAGLSLKNSFRLVLACEE